jgi:uncharacterized protein Smg (DUF494 family)
MSFTEMLDQLPALTLEQRQELVARVMEMDEPPLTPEQEKIIQERLASFHRNPESGISLEDLMKNLRAETDK